MSDENHDPMDQGQRPAFRRQREETSVGTAPRVGRGLFSSSNSNRGAGARNYCCPRCDGEFNSWDKVISNPDEAAGIDPTRQAANRKGVCPFCGLERRSYDPDGDAEAE